MPWEPLPGSSGEPVPVDSGIERVLRSLGAPTSSALTSLFENWSDMVGEQLADHAHPVQLSDTTLKVSVDDPGWATQVRWMMADILGRLEQGLGPGVVTDIEVSVTTPGKSRSTPNRLV
jgi:predicted nucleic acid-binding Zn ribbon protein